MKKITLTLLMLIVSSTLHAANTPCPPPGNIATFTQGKTYSDCVLVANGVNMEANVVIKNSQIQTGLLTTNANVSIENSQLKATKANLASGTSLGSNSQVDAQSFCLDSQGSYTFNGSVIIGDVTNVSEAFLKATNATYKFFTYLGVCS